MVFTEAKLVWVQNVVFGQKLGKLKEHYFFKYFRNNWEQRNGPVAVERRLIARLKDRDN